MEKKNWQSPELDVLDVSMTMLGRGTKYTDWTFIGGQLDLDITDTPTPPPGVPVS
ncbi:paeninodin family lasso peptide [Paenibacillus tarimensis]